MKLYLCKKSSHQRDISKVLDQLCSTFNTSKFKSSLKVSEISKESANPWSVFEHKLSFLYLSFRTVFTLVLFALEIFLNLNFKIFEEKWNGIEPRWSSGNSNCSRYKWTSFRNCFTTSYHATPIYPPLGRTGIPGLVFIGHLTITGPIGVSNRRISKFVNQMKRWNIRKCIWEQCKYQYKFYLNRHF